MVFYFILLTISTIARTDNAAAKIDKAMIKTFIFLTFWAIYIIIKGGSNPPLPHPVSDLTKLAIAVMRFAKAVIKRIFSTDGFLLPLFLLPIVVSPPFRIYIIP